MPTGSLVLGVDLLPIKAIRNVKTLVSDITTAECRYPIVLIDHIGTFDMFFFEQETHRK